MPNSTILKEIYQCPLDPSHNINNKDFFLIVDANLQLYPRDYKRMIRSKVVTSEMMPMKIAIMGCNICFVQALEKVLSACISSFKDTFLSEYLELVKIDNGGYYSDVSHTCRNSDSSLYHYGSTLNKTGDVIIVGEMNCMVANFSRYYLLKNKVLKITIDACNTCYNKPLNQINIIMKQRIIDKVLKDPAFKAHDPERTQAYLMGMFGSLQKDSSLDQ
jgi:hypothetical protein